MSNSSPFRRLKHPLAQLLRSPRVHRFFRAFFAPRSRTGIAPDIRRAKSILILKPDEIGDVVLATGFFRSIRRQCPGARITILLRALGADLVDALGVADEIILRPEWWGDPEMSGRKVLSIVRHARARWRHGAPDFVLIARSGRDYSGSPYYAAWTGSPGIWAHEDLVRDGTRDFTPLCAHVVSRPAWVHQVEDHKRMLRELGLDDAEADPGLLIPAAARAALARQVDSSFLAGSTVAFGLGASAPNRRWPVENFIALARRLLEAHPRLNVALIGGGDDRPAAEAFRALDSARILPACGTLPLLESAALLERCALYVGNDTGPMHIAAALGRPVVEISKHPRTAGPESNHSPRRFGPLAPWSRVLQPEPLAPACRDGCGYPTPHCITAVSVAEVFQAVQEGLHFLSSRAAS